MRALPLLVATSRVTSLVIRERKVSVRMCYSIWHRDKISMETLKRVSTAPASYLEGKHMRRISISCYSVISASQTTLKELMSKLLLAGPLFPCQRYNMAQSSMCEE